MDFQLILALFASIIIISLAFYAGMLIKRINIQKLAVAQAATEQAKMAASKKAERNNNICESICFIAKATAQKQCNVSEAAIRLSVLLETLLVEPKIDIDKASPAISSLFEKVKDFSTHAERKTMDKKILKQQDKQRHFFEKEFEDAIIAEAKSLQSFSL